MIIFNPGDVQEIPIELAYSRTVSLVVFWRITLRAGLFSVKNMQDVVAPKNDEANEGCRNGRTRFDAALFAEL